MQTDRLKTFLKNKYSRIFYYIGDLLILLGYLFLFPILLLLFYPEELNCIHFFLWPGIIINAIGYNLKKSFSDIDLMALTQPESEIIVFFSWVLVIVLSAFPIAQIANLNFSQAIFESVSGWTTTGLSVVNVESAPNILLFWRSLIQLVGGAGLAIILVSSITGVQATGISISEGRGDQLVPHVKKSAELVVSIYASYTIIGIIAYKLAGMGLFDAINHTFAAVSTGGFSTRAASIGYWNSPVIEAITIPLMFFGSLSFLSAWLLIKGNFRAFLANGELKLFAFLSSLSSMLLFLFTCWNLYPGLGKSIRVAVFEAVSALTTTGFSTVSYNNWNSSGIFVMIILMLIGGGTCSTAGGIKQIRIWLMFQLIKCEIKRLFHPPKTIVEMEIQSGSSKSFFSDAMSRRLGVFFGLYLFCYFIGVLILTLQGASTSDAMFEFASSLGTVGLSIGLTSPDMPLLTLWSQTIAMFLGRLEFFVVIVSIFRIFDDCKAYFSSKTNH